MAVMIYRCINYEGTASEPTQPSDPPHTTEPTGDENTMTVDEMKAEIVRLTGIEHIKAGLPELMDCAQAKAMT